MKKKVLLSIITTLFIIGGTILGYRLAVINKYSIKSIQKSEWMANLKKMYESNQKKKITKMAESMDKKLSIKNFSIRNDFEDFEYSSETDPFGSAISYTLYGENKGIQAKISLAILKQSADWLKEDFSLLGVDEKTMSTKEDRKELLEKENITTDLDLLKYLYSNKDYKTNLFTKTSELRLMHDIMNFSQAGIALAEESYFLEGDYEGYYIKRKNVTVCNIIKDNQIYAVTFMGDFFTEDYINELLNTINIEKPA